MTQLIPVITDAGLAAAIAADSLGVQLEITHVGFGSGAYDPLANRTALAAESARVTVGGSVRAGARQIRLSAVWRSEVGQYPIQEIGVYAGSVLFAVWSRAAGGPVAVKDAGVDFIFTYDLVLNGIPEGSVTILVDPNMNLGTQAVFDHESELDPHPQYAKDLDLAQHLQSANPHPLYATDAELAAHVGASNPHGNYILKWDFANYMREVFCGVTNNYDSFDDNSFLVAMTYQVALPPTQNFEGYFNGLFVRFKPNETSVDTTIELRVNDYPNIPMVKSDGSAIGTSLLAGGLYDAVYYDGKFYVMNLAPASAGGGGGGGGGTSNYGKKLFAANGTFTVPADVNSVVLTMVGGGGGGQGHLRYQTGPAPTLVPGVDGQHGEFVYGFSVAVTPGDNISVTIGQGGAGGAFTFASSSGTQNNGTSGTDTSFGTLKTVAGGKGGGVVGTTPNANNFHQYGKQGIGGKDIYQNGAAGTNGYVVVEWGVN